MFSQWRQAVESLAQGPVQPPSKPSQDADTSRGSSDSIRPSPSTIQPRPSTSESPGSRQPGHRTTLEDRLRAKFAIGDASNSTTPNASSRPSRVTTPMSDHPLSPPSSSRPQSPTPEVKADFVHPLSPTSAPLPDSPLLTSVNTLDTLSIERMGAAEVDIPSLSIEAVNMKEPELVTGHSGKKEPEDHISSVAPSEAHEVQNKEEIQDSERSIAYNEEGGGELLPEISNSREEFQPPEEPHPTTSEDSTTGIRAQDDIEVKSISAATPHDVPAPIVALKPDIGSDSTSGVLPPDASNGNPLPLALSDPPGSPDPPVSPLKADEPDVEVLQRRLKLVEQRFTDVSTSFKRLQAEKAAADRVLHEHSPLESIHDAESFSDYLQNLNFKTEMAQDEIKRLTGKLVRQEERIEELRDTHRLESKSQSDQIDRLRSQLEETEALLKASQAFQAEVADDSGKKKAEMEALMAEVEKAKNAGREEEEKRVKAIALLKTVRQKLVKAEKDRDDAMKELHALKETVREEREREQEEKQKLVAEIDRVNNERETAVVGLRAQFDKEVSGLKERQERELLALRGQFELEAVTTKAAYTKELDAKASRISQLDTIAQTLRAEKDDLFDQLQLRQAELESSRHLLDSLQSQASEYQYQIRESTERVALLQEELAEAQRQQSLGLQSPSASADEVSRLLLGAEAKFDTRLAELRRQLAVVEKERDEGEVEWSRKLNEKLREIEALKRTVARSAKSEDDEKGRIDTLKVEIARLHEELRLSQAVISELKEQAGRIVDAETATRSQLADANTRANTLLQQLEDFKGREAQLRANNKTLREELRKVQSSAALLERQRNPGVGYWARNAESSSDARSPRSSVSDLPSHNGQNGQTSRPGSPAPTANRDEEVNFEYLRNVILQFLEHKEMRPHLVRILSTILHFTPQETRRLVSKV